MPAERGTPAGPACGGSLSDVLSVKACLLPADIENVMLFTFGPRLRLILLTGLLGAAALGAGLLVVNRYWSDTGTEAPLAKPKQADSAAQPETAAPASPSTSPAAPPAAAGDRLPSVIEAALGANRVVVVSLYAPKAKVDSMALREASAGAQLAGAAFAPIDVTTAQVDALNRRYGALHDPAVLVLRPPGDLIVRIDGFADRDTVAQAAANAAS